jgi:hypothetical protein
MAGHRKNLLGAQILPHRQLASSALAYKVSRITVAEEG